MIETDPVSARFVGGPFDGETHLLAHRLPFVQLPAPGEQFFARLLIEEPDAPDHLVYELVEGEAAAVVVERSVAPTGGARRGEDDGLRSGDERDPDGNGNGETITTIVYRCRADLR